MPNGLPGPFFMQGVLATLDTPGLISPADLRRISEGQVVVVGVKTSEYSANPRELVVVNPTAGSFSIHLPPAGGLAVSDAIVVVNLSGSLNDVLVDSLGGDVNGEGLYPLAGAYASASFVPLLGQWVASPPL